MSYILEALKKADAERERGVVPGLHTQAEPLPLDERPAPAGTPASVWVMAGLTSGAALAVVYALWGGIAPPVAPPPPPSAPELVVAPPPAPPRLAPTVPSPDPAPILPPPEAPQQALAPRPAKQAQATASAPVPTVRSTAGQNAERVSQPPLSLSELPESVRRELPTLSIGGAMHSDTPSSRMLILSSGVFREGEQPAPGLVLEEIRLKSAVFRYKGYRYSVTY